MPQPPNRHPGPDPTPDDPEPRAPPGARAGAGAIRPEEPSAEIGFKEMCARFEVTPRTLRYYEYIELLAPRREGRQRHYRPRELARMTLIRRGRRCGFSLEEIRQWLQMREAAGSAAQMRAFLDLADAQLRALDEQRAQIEETMTELRQLREAARAGLRAGEDAAAQGTVDAAPPQAPARSGARA